MRSLNGIAEVESTRPLLKPSVSSCTCLPANTEAMAHYEDTIRRKVSLERVSRFLIDAAFEIENSTTIFSGLLRFADLTIMAPNTTYPPFIVAPNERKNRVREQLRRPSFGRLALREKVRFLSYERVQEIDDFFRDRIEACTLM